MSEMQIDSSKGPAGIQFNELKQDTRSYKHNPYDLLPSNSAYLSDYVGKALAEIDLQIEEEQREKQRLQRQITVWEEKIRSNYFQMGKNIDQINSNLSDAENDAQHRDYWWSREHLVTTDFSYVRSSNRPSDWTWVIKKYDLKNADGTPLDPNGRCIEEVCLGAIRHLEIEYKEAGVRYDLAQNYKRVESQHLSSMNTKLSLTNEYLRNYINNVHTIGIEPIVDGIQFLKEFNLKLKTFEKQKMHATFGEMRLWAEEHLDRFLKKYPSIPHRVVNTFRKVASIPLLST